MGPSLYQFFHRHIQHGFRRTGLAEPGMVDYVSDILTRFAHTAALYPLTDQNDRPLDSVVQFLTEQQAAQNQNPAREALLVRHLAEYTLFMSGFFRERLRARGQLAYYVDHGRSAFGQSADFERNAGCARVLWQLHRDFPRVAAALSDIREHQFPLAENSRQPLTALWRM